MISRNKAERQQDFLDKAITLISGSDDAFCHVTDTDIVFGIGILDGWRCFVSLADGKVDQDSGYAVHVTWDGTNIVLHNDETGHEVHCFLL